MKLLSMVGDYLQNDRVRATAIAIAIKVLATNFGQHALYLLITMVIGL